MSMSIPVIQSDKQYKLQKLSDTEKELNSCKKQKVISLYFSPAAA